MSTKRSSRWRNARAKLLQALAEHIEHTIEEIIEYERLHFFDTDEISRILSRNIDKRISRLEKQLQKDSTSTSSSRRRPAPPRPKP